MKTYSIIFIIAGCIMLSAGCNSSGTSGKSSGNANDSSQVADTGYTGIKKYTSGDKVMKEVSFRNGVRYGLTKTFYPGGQVYQTFWYENDLREDSARWYYPEGKLFRTTPFKRDTIDGIQKQFYRNGKVKAKIGFSKGLRTPYFSEYTQEGKLITNYPEIVVKINDEYNSRGSYRIGLELSDKSTKVNFFRGEFFNGVHDTSKCAKINTISGKATLVMKKTGKPGKNYVGIIAEVITPFSNKNIIFKKVELPYNDLN